MKTSALFSIFAFTLTMNLSAGNSEMEPIKTHASLNEISALDAFDITEEEPLELDDWMFDIEAFNESPEILDFEELIMDLKEMDEPEILLEDWMFDETLFFSEAETSETNEPIDFEAFLNEISNDEEELIEIEEWMFSVEYFSAEPDETMSPTQKLTSKF